MRPSDYQPLTCQQCLHVEKLDFDFSFAFQPIVDVRERRIVSYEALVRGTGGESAATVFAKVDENNLYRFDQACRVKAIKLAVELGVQTRLNLNFAPNAVYKPELCIRTTLKAAEEYGFPVERIVFEVTESEKVQDHDHLVNIINAYRRMGFSTAIDDFGAGFSGLNLLARYQPDCIKLDRVLVSGIASSPARQAIVRGIALTCAELGMALLAEGVETREEYLWLADCGIALCQGYYFARPAFESLPQVNASVF